MSDYVSRQYLLDEYDRQHQGPPGGARKIIAEAPAEDVVPVVHAHWKDNKNGTVSCSRCSTWFQKERVPYLSFCGYCGARMDGKREE